MHLAASMTANSVPSCFFKHLYPPKLHGEKGKSFNAGWLFSLHGSHKEQRGKTSPEICADKTLVHFSHYVSFI